MRTATPLNTSNKITRPKASVIAAKHLLGESDMEIPCLLLSYKPNLQYTNKLLIYYHTLTI